MAPNTLPIVQLVLSVLCVCLSISIVATAADTLRIYKQQRDTLNPWWLPLWPEHFNTSSTPTLIGIGATIAVLHLINIAVTAVPRITMFRSPMFTWLLTTLVTVPGSLLALIAIVYTHVLNSGSNSSTNTDTIMTWTCKFRNTQPPGRDATVVPEMSNDSFGKLCDESRYAYYAMIPVLILQVIMIGVSFVAWRSASKVRREQQKMYEGSPERGSPVEIAMNSK